MSVILQIAMWVAFAAWITSLSLIALLLVSELAEGVRQRQLRRRFHRQLHSGRRPW